MTPGPDDAWLRGMIASWLTKPRTNLSPVSASARTAAVAWRLLAARMMFGLVVDVQARSLFVACGSVARVGWGRRLLLVRGNSAADSARKVRYNKPSGTAAARMRAAASGRDTST